MAIARIASQDKTGTTSATYPVTPTGNDLLLCRVVSNSASTTLSGWTNVGSVIEGSTYYVYMFAKTSQGNEGTITPSGGTIENIAICEYTGAAYPFALDGGSSAVTTDTNTSTTSLGTGTITLRNPNSLIFICCGLSSIANESGYGWNSSTVILSVTGVALGSYSGQYLPGTSGSLFSDTASWTTSAHCGLVMAAFSPATQFLSVMGVGG